MTDKTIEQKAQEMADGLGISFYVRDGRIWQNGPGQEIRPGVHAKPAPYQVDEVDLLKGVAQANDS